MKTSSLVIVIGSGIIGCLTALSGYGWIEDGSLNWIGLLVNISAVILWVVLVNIVDILINDIANDKNI